MATESGPLDWLFERFAQHKDDQAVVWQDNSYTYGQLLQKIDEAQGLLQQHNTPPGRAVVVDADYSPGSIALLLAVIQNRDIVVPVAARVKADRDKYGAITEATSYFQVTSADTYACSSYPHQLQHPLSQRLVQGQHPGLVLFSSGSTGEPKASLHNLDFLLNKFKTPRHSKRIITFLLFDHIGGFNTLMYTLSNHGCVIALDKRDPQTVCEAIEKHRAEILPTSPTFLNLLLMTEAYRERDLSSLKLITYGTEAMPEMALKRLNQIFPEVRFLQTYGLSELGILRSKSRDSDSLWVKVGGEDYETRIVDNKLHIRARCSMLGYLNAPSPFDDEGWFNTQDEVEVDGEWLKFKGRESDIINVGGEKVYPAEVESVLLEVDNVIDATVSRQPHPITGNIVVATVALRQPEDIKAVKKRVRSHCFARLERFKVPVKIDLAKTDNVSERFKKVR